MHWHNFLPLSRWTPEASKSTINKTAFTQYINLAHLAVSVTLALVPLEYINNSTMITKLKLYRHCWLRNLNQS